MSEHGVDLSRHGDAVTRALPPAWTVRDVHTVSVEAEQDILDIGNDGKVQVEAEELHCCQGRGLRAPCVY